MSAFTEPLAQVRKYRPNAWGNKAVAEFDAALAQVERLATDMETALAMLWDHYLLPITDEQKAQVLAVLSAREEGAA